MSVSTEVQRTLVKSPPELWTELSNPEALARHLGDFGEIRITNTEPETKVEWEAEEVSGVVQLKQSGWGTKVTLSVTRTPAIPEPTLEPESAAVAGSESTIVAEPEPTAVAESESTIVAEPEPTAVAESEPVPAVELKPAAAGSEPTAAEPPPVGEPERAAEPEAVPSEPGSVPPPVEPEPPLGFFARLFRKRKAKPASVAEPELEVVALAAPEPIEVVALAAPEPIYPDPPAQPEAVEPAEDLASELESLEDQMAAETTELLTGVLDRLGAAHHRPFSRG
jgi:hypothetical protein